MKKLLLFLFAVFMFQILAAQTVVFHENFEFPSGADSVVTTADSAGFPTTNFQPWSLSTHLAKSGVSSDSNKVQVGKTIYLTTNSFSTLGNNFVILEFAQICKLLFLDGGQIDVSTNNGTSWTTLSATQYMGSGVMSLSKFSENSYSVDWKAGDTITKPTNSWWKDEKFDISTIAANQANVKIRFRFYGSGSIGSTVRYGWLLDEIKVSMSPSELDAPSLAFASLPADTVYTAGPYNVSVYSHDASGVETVTLNYKYGNGSFNNILMTRSSIVDSLFTASIPFGGWGKKINYYVTSMDSSSAHNLATYPSSAYKSFFCKFVNGGLITLGTGTSTGNYPFFGNWGYSRSVSVYNLNEIKTFGPVNQLSWNVSTGTPTVFPIKIYLKQITSDVMTADTFANLINGATLVFNDTVRFNSMGWKNINLATPFNYTSGNLMVLCEANYGGSGAGSGNYPSFYYSTSTSGTHQTFYKDSSPPVVAGTIGTSRPNITINVVESAGLTQDAGIAQIVNPVESVTANTAFNVEVKIKNFGSYVLAKATVKYAVDGGTPVPFAWTGSLSYNTVSTTIVAGSLNLAPGVHNLKIWAELPNDSVDQNNINDTSYVKFYACASPLNGSYTVGGTTAAFSTLDDVIMGLNLCGVSGPVVFYINPGTYNTQLTIPQINGASALNTITFKAVNNDSTSVIINYNASSVANNWIVKLNGADYFRFKNINFAPANTIYSNAIVFANGATNNEISGNLFTGNPGTSDDLISVRIEDTASVNNAIIGNQFNSGSIAVKCKGSSTTSLLSNIIIKNNTINNFNKYGIYSEYVNKMHIEGNEINSITSVTSKYGIYMHYAYDTVKVVRNNISLNGATDTYGILFEDCHASDTTKGLIANNFVSITNGVDYAYGIRTLATDNQKIYNNSMVVNGASLTNTRGINVVSGSGKIDILNNNILSNRYPLYVEIANTGKCDYNNYYSTASVFVLWNNTAYANLQALRTANQKDSNSVSVNPFFISLSNLHTFNGYLSGAGKSLTQVTTDIDGDLRANPPCIGADEFISPANDATLVSVIARNSCGLTSNEDVTLVIKNIGTAAIASSDLTATYGFVGANNTLVNIVSPEIVNRTIAAGDTVHFTFAAKANLSVAATHLDSTFRIKSWVNLISDNSFGNDTNQLATLSSYTPVMPVVSNYNCGYSSAIALTATSSDTLYWYDAITGGNFLYSGLNYTTVPLFSTVNYYVEAKASTPVNVQIGNGISSQYFPFNSYFGYSRNASVYKASEIGGHGLVSKIQYQVSTSGSAIVPIKIYLKEISSDVMTSQNWTTLISGAVLVYNDTMKFNQTGWKNISLTTPYNFSSGNLMVLCEGNYGGSGASGNPKFNYTTASSGTYQDVAKDGSIPVVNLTLGSSRPNIKLNIALSGCASERAAITVTVAAPPPIDLGLTQITSPSQSVPSAVSQPVNMKIKNFGLTALTTANVNYQIDNGSVTTFAWTATTPLAFNASEIVTVTNIAFAPGLHKIKAWTSNPNNVQDTVGLNDTTSISFLANFHGTYTIGATVAGVQKDFPTFSAAASVLSVAGVSDAVLFLVDSGSYTEQLRIPQITGADAAKTITFRSLNNDSTSVRLQYAATTAANYTLNLDSADFIRFEKMTIKALDSTYGRVVVLTNGANYNELTNNIIEMPVTISSNSTGVYSNGHNNFNKIENNIIKNGYCGLYIYGISATNTQKGNIIKNNNIANFYYYGIQSYYQDSVQIIKNTIKTITTNYSGYGIYASYNNNSLLISKNIISINSNSTSTYGTLCGLYLNYCSATTTNKSLVANNAISIEGGTATASIYGLYSYYSNFQNLYYNSVNIVSVFANPRAFYVSGGSEIKVINNNFVNTGGGMAYYSGSTTAVVASDYNNLFTTGSVLGYYSSNKNTLTDFQTASSKDIHSLSVNPLFVANHDLHLTSTPVCAAATPLTEINDDIDGQIRHLTAPTIGSDEFPLYQFDAEVIAILKPVAIDTEAMVRPVKVIIKNIGVVTITTMPVYYKLNNGTPVAFTYNGSIASLGVDTITLPSFTVPSGNNSICAYTALVGDINLINDQTCKDFFGKHLFDADVSRISPISGGCALTNDTVRLWIKNKGVSAINGGITASYKVVGGSNVVTQAVTATIANADSTLFTFNAPVDLSVTSHDSTYIIKAWATLTNDILNNNDTATTSVESLYTPAIPIANNISIPYGTFATITATSLTNVPIIWYDVLSGGSKIDTGSVHITPVLFANDTLYAETSTVKVINTTIGTGTNTLNAPFNGNWGYSRSATVYTSSEINGNGLIEKLAWNVSTIATASFPVKIYLKDVSNSTMISQTWSDLTAGATLVYSGNTTFNTLGWKEFLMSSPYIYNGFSNLMVLCETNYTGSGSSGNYPSFKYTSGISGSQQNNNQDYSSATDAGDLSADRPNIKIISAPKGCASARVAVKVTVTQQSPADAGVIAIVSPNTGVNLENNETVVVKIKNFGTNAIQNFAVSYKINNSAVVTENVTNSIASNDTLMYSFTQKADLHFLDSTYVFKAFTSIANDATALNDTTIKLVVNNIAVYCESRATSNGDEDIGNVTFAGINNGNSLPVLHNPNSDQMYNDYTNLATANIHPGVTFPISVSVIFKNGPYLGKCNVYIDYNRNGNWDLPGELALTSDYMDTVTTITANITVPSNARFGLTKMRVVVDESDVAPACGTYTWGETEDYNVRISPQLHNDAGITAITDIAAYLPYSASATQSAKLVIKNFGTDALANATVKYVVNGTVNTFNWTKTPALQTMDSDTFLISNIAIQQGMNLINAYTVLNGDTNYFNDAVNKKVFKESVFTIPYTDNFDMSSLWFATDTNALASINNLWEQGAPAASVINAAHSGPNVWATNLDGNYTANNTSILYSPKFNMGSMIADTMTFWQWRNFGNNAYGRIEYLNNSNAWTVLGSVNDTNATNWYTSANGFDTISNGWVKSTYKLNNLTNVANVTQFKFTFVTGTTTTPLNGWAIDDISLTLAPLAHDAGVIAITTPGNASLVGDTVYPVVTIKNFGTDPLTSVPVKYQINGQAAVAATWTGNLLPGNTVDYTFANRYVVNTTDYSICAFTAFVGDIYTMNDSTCNAITVNPALLDVAVTEIVTPGDTAVNGTIAIVKVKIKNFGSTAVTSVPVVYQRGNSTPVSETWTGNALNTGDEVIYTFTQTFTVAMGSQFSFSAYTNLANDAYPQNNKKTKTVVIGTVGIDDIDADNLWLGQNMPNPTNSITNIEYNLPTNGEVVFNLVNMIGQNVYTETLKTDAGRHQIQLNVNDLTNGVYYYAIEFKGKRLVKKMVVNK